MSIEEVYPCTPYHEGLLISQLGNDTYVSHTIWKVERMGSTNQIDPVQLQKAWYQLARRHAALRTILVEAALEDVEGGTLTHVVLDSYPREVKIICCTDDEAMHVLRHPTLNSRDNAGLFFRMSLLSAKPIRPRVL